MDEEAETADKMMEMLDRLPDLPEEVIKEMYVAMAGSKLLLEGVRTAQADVSLVRDGAYGPLPLAAVAKLNEIAINLGKIK